MLGGTFQQLNFFKIFKKHGLHRRITTPYHPQANGKVALSNGEINKIMNKINESNYMFFRRCFAWIS